MLADHYAAIDAPVRKHPDATLEERRDWLLHKLGASVSIGTMWSTLRRLKNDAQKRPSRQASGRVRTSPEPTPPCSLCRPAY